MELPYSSHGPFTILAYKQFLPAGRIKDPKGRVIGMRKRSLVQIFTDYGLRTVAVAQVWSRNPQQSNSPW